MKLRLHPLFQTLLRRAGLEFFRAGTGQGWWIQRAAASPTSYPRRLSDACHWEHIRVLTNTLQIGAVLDVGANQGDFGRKLRQIGYSGRIASFEPNPDLFPILENTARQDQHWRCYCFAIGDQCTRRTLTVAKQSTLSSFARPTPYGLARFGDSMKRSKEVDVSVRRLDALFATELNDLRSERIFLKLDTQGFDVHAFDGMGSWIQNVWLLQCELSMQPVYESSTPFEDMLKHLAGYGLRPARFYPVCVDPETHYAIELDCLLVKTNPV